MKLKFGIECPHKIHVIFNRDTDLGITKTGSLCCQKCSFNVKTDLENRVVLCDYEEPLKRNIDIDETFGD